MRSVLVAAISGRALAAAARRSGFVPLVADLFADLDTRRLAAKVVRVSGSVAEGLGRESLLTALAVLAQEGVVDGVVYGGGFEDRVELLAEIARGYRLIGNSATVVARLKDPLRFAALCQCADVPHPQTQRQRPIWGHWLEKRAGGAGGTHVRTLADRGRASPYYYQRHLAGRAVSALFLADGKRAVVLGLSEQWTDPVPASPFRYGGAARPALVPAVVARAMRDCLVRLTRESGLVGLCSADFMMRHGGFDLLEINPRPGATLDIYQDKRLFGWHVDACGGCLPDEIEPFAGAAAAAVVYARTPIRLSYGFIWPQWTADRQPPGEEVAAGAPFCTVLAEAETAALARESAQARGAAILALAGASP
jgi:uncharacterized protein